MVLNLKPATAVLALLPVDALALTAAEHSRRKESLAGGGATDRSKQDIDQLVRIVDAEFLPGSDGEGANGGPMTKQLGEGQSLVGNARARFVQQPRIQRLLQDIKRKRELTGTVKRGVDKQKADASLIECSLNVELLEEGQIDGADDIIDAGLLGKCDEGYACVASESSGLGGLCSPTVSTERTLQQQQDECLPGCPAEVCECLAMDPDGEGYDYLSCIEATVASCRDGSYFACQPTINAAEDGYTQVFCDANICAADNGLLTGAVPDDYTYGECACAQYVSFCANIRPICEAEGSSAGAYVCDDGSIDYYCEVAACCENGGGSTGECFGYSVMPTPERTFVPTSTPIGGNDESSTGPPSDASKTPIAANAFLGTFVLASSLIQALV